MCGVFLLKLTIMSQSAEVLPIIPTSSDLITTPKIKRVMRISGTFSVIAGGTSGLVPRAALVSIEEAHTGAAAEHYRRPFEELAHAVRDQLTKQPDRTYVCMLNTRGIDEENKERQIRLYLFPAGKFRPKCGGCARSFVACCARPRR